MSCLNPPSVIRGFLIVFLRTLHVSELIKGINRNKKTEFEAKHYVKLCSFREALSSEEVRCLVFLVEISEL